MAISKARKEELVAQYTDILSSANGFIIVQSSGMSVKQTEAMRAKIREANGQYVRAKNTLFRIALQNAGWTVPDELLQGTVNVAFSMDNFPGVAKTVLEYITSKDANLAELASVTGGVMGEEVLSATKVDQISSLPSLDDLHAQIAGLLVQPATGLVSVLNSATGQLVNVLHAYVQENGGEAA